MPKNWKTYKFEELTTKLGDGLHGTPKYSLDGEYYFINGNNLTDGKIEIKPNTKRVNKNQFIKYQKPLNDRTIFVSINGTLGNVATYNNEKVVLGKSACYFNVREDVHKEFIKQYVSTSDFKRFLENNATGSVIKNVSLKSMRDHEINLPPLPEQKAIANILSAIDDKIENNRAINKTLEDMAMALYKHWFVDFGPFQDGEFIDSELGLIPEGWEVKRLDELANFKNGKGIKRSDRTEDGLYTIFGSNGFIGRTNKVMFKDYVIAIGRVGANYGEIHYSTEPCWISDNAITVQPKVKKCFWWLLQTLRLIDYSNFAGGSAQPLITQGAVKDFIVSVPREKELLDFSLKLKQLFDNLNSNLKENQSLIKLRDTLLPKLISGEIRLKKFRAQVENLV